MRRRLEMVAETAHLHAPMMLAMFAASAVALNWGRWSEWGREGFSLYLTQPIMQTTLYDFAWVLGILTLFIHQDATKHGLRYWYVLLTYPVMPAVGLLIYIWLRHRRLSKLGHVPPLGS